MNIWAVICSDDNDRLALNIYPTRDVARAAQREIGGFVLDVAVASLRDQIDIEEVLQFRRVFGDVTGFEELEKELGICHCGRRGKNSASGTSTHN